MNLNIPLLRPVRILLLPFSLFYFLVIWIRNLLYDRHIIGSTAFNLPVISVGNLSVGGTGKSPMVEYLAVELKDKFSIALLSRGYKRKTKGYALADSTSNALDIGDEPMQFHRKFPEIAVAVGEERIVAIPQLLHDKPQTEVIILDDAFQHRSVKPGLNILLTDYSNLFTRDWYLPTGDLRDEKRSYRRAEIIVITKCPEEMDHDEQRELSDEIKPHTDQQLFFSSLEYGVPYHVSNGEKKMIESDTEVLLVTGIANPRPLKKYLQDNSKTYYQISYSDHHIFTIDDLREIITRFSSLTETNKLILTTEKDAVRLQKFDQQLKDLPFYVIPVKPKFLFDATQKFSETINTFITNFDKQP